VDGTAPFDPDALGPADGESRTMVVGPEYTGYAAPPPSGSIAARVGAVAGRAAALLRHGGPGAAGAHTAPHGSDPVLYRWLFSGRVVYVLGALVALIAVAGGGWYLTSGRYAPVPAVRTLSPSAATAALRAAGFKVQTGPSVIDDNVQKGEVIGTSPAGKALPGSTITLTVSQGPKMITVPPIPANDTVAQAMAVLRQAGLAVAPKAAAVGVPSNPQIGTIAGTTPAAGTSWPENKPVQVDVVEGLGVPSLVGQNIQNIQGWAGQHNINVQPTQVNSSELAGTILSQTPAPGTIIKPGQTTVDVTVSNGGPQLQVPSVQGESCQQGEQTVKQAGFTNVTTQQGFFNNGNATGTNPGQGSSAQAATPIVVECGFGAAFRGGF